MTQSDAALFERVGKLAVRSSDGAFVAAHDKEWLQKSRGVAEQLHFALAELDILYPTALVLDVFPDDSREDQQFFFGERILLLKRGEITSDTQLPIWKFTFIGAELLPLVPSPLDDAYLEQIGLFFVKMKGKAFIAQATHKHADGRVEYEIVREVISKEPTPTNAT